MGLPAGRKISSPAAGDARAGARGTDYLPQDGSRPHLALGVDALQELRVADAGDVIMPSGEMDRSLGRLESAVLAVAASGAVRGDRFLQIGLRGYWPEPPTLAWMAEQRMRSFEMTEVVTRGLDDCLTEAFTLPLAGIDVVEVAPPYDHAEVTGFLANRVVLEALSGIAWRRRLLAADPARPARRPERPLLEGR